jgi:excisionase family DNA binding protein
VTAPLWTPKTLAAYLGLRVQTLYDWRHAGQGPAGFRLGKHLRYHDEDVQAWLAEQRAAENRRPA